MNFKNIIAKTLRKIANWLEPEQKYTAEKGEIFRNEVYSVLTPDQYKKLESKFPIYVGHDSSAHQAAMQLGAQAVLKEIRNGLVVG